MRTPKWSRVAFVVPVFALGAISMAEAARPAAAPAVACKLTVADTVFTGRRMHTVVANYYQDIGDSLSASFLDDAMITVTRVTPRTTTNPISVEVTMNTENAQIGTWSMTLTGRTGSCYGDVLVARGIVKK